MNASTTRYMMVVLAAATAVAVLTGTWYARRARNLREEDMRIRAELATNQRLVAALRRARAGVTGGAVVSREPGAPTAKPVVAARSPAANAGHALMERLQTRPEYARFVQLDRRRATWRLYGDLFNQLKLSPERLAQLKRLLDEAGQSDQDARDAAARMGIASGDPAHSRLLNATREENAASIRAFLQPEELAMYQDFQRAQGWNFIYAPEFRDFAADRGAPPLSPEQKQALSTAFARAQEWIDRAGGAQLTVTASHRRMTARFAELAAEALAPAQHAVLTEYLEFAHSRGELLARLAYPDRPAGSVIVTVSSWP